MLIRKGRGNGLVLILLAMIMLVAVIMMVEARDPKGYYKTLGVSNKATQQEIKQAYRKLSLSYHPDKSRNKPQAEQKTLQQQYMKILEAYETLSDEDKRRQYDRGGFDPFEHHHEGHSNHHDGGSSFHFSFGDDSENDPFQDFPQFFKHHFRSQGEQGHPFFSFFGDDDDDDDDAPPFGFHFESSHSNDRRRNQKRRASSKSQETVKEEEGGFFSSIMGVIGDFYNGLMSLIEDSQPEEFQTVKKIITQINPDGTRTTRVVYEKVPINRNGKRTVFQF